MQNQEGSRAGPPDTGRNPPLVTLPQLALRVQRTPERLRSDLRRGRIQADRYGGQWLFSADQVADALIYYTDLTQQERARDAAAGS